MSNSRDQDPNDRGPSHPDSVDQGLILGIRSEHQQLHSFFQDTRAAISAGEGETACAQLRAAFESHFAQEESLYYPTLWKLCPEYEGDLREIIGAHSMLLDQLDSILVLLQEGEKRKAQAYFEELLYRFSKHERREELMLRSMGDSGPRSHPAH
jgi:hypothetical protein